MSTSAIRRVVDLWKSEGMCLHPPLPIAEIEQLSASLWRPLPEEVKFLYSICGGMPTGSMDQRWFELWPLKRAVEESSRFPRGFVPFAEGFLSAHLYCLQLNPGKSASVHICDSSDGTSLELVASSLDDAFCMLMNSPSALHLP